MPGDDLEFGIVTGQDWRDWATIRRQWLWAEQTGRDSAWLFERFWSLRPTRDGPTLEAWTLLAALAAETSSIRIGTQVSGITHRHLSVLLKQAVTVDQVSNGRLILGIGAGWAEEEHRVYGIPFPGPPVRVGMVRDFLEAARRAEGNKPVKFSSSQLKLIGAPFWPNPVRGHIRVMIATGGIRCSVMSQLTRTIGKQRRRQVEFGNSIACWRAIVMRLDGIRDRSASRCQRIIHNGQWQVIRTLQRSSGRAVLLRKWSEISENMSNATSRLRRQTRHSNTSRQMSSQTSANSMRTRASVSID